jgi:hypothetical protein
VERGSAGLGAHIGHTEDLAALKLFLQVGNDGQELGVGIQEVPETGVPKAEDLRDLPRRGLPLFPLLVQLPEKIEGFYHAESSEFKVQKFGFAMTWRAEGAVPFTLKFYKNYTI